MYHAPGCNNGGGGAFLLKKIHLHIAKISKKGIFSGIYV